jgi:hypothetical protein
MTTSDQEEQAERRRVLLQDADLRRRQQEQAQREQSGTYLSHTHDDLSGGRFAALGNPTIVGSTEATRYPAASAAHQIQLPDEPPLGFDNPELEPSFASLASVQDPGGAAARSSPADVEPAPPSSPVDDPASAPSGGSSVQQPSGGLVSERAGSSPSQKDQDNG